MALVFIVGVMFFDQDFHLESKRPECLRGRARDAAFSA
jgi:hypothetical protein